MTATILRLFRPEIKPPTEHERRMELLHYRVRQLGDRVREVNRWAVAYRFRTGRAA